MEPVIDQTDMVAYTHDVFAVMSQYYMFDMHEPKRLRAFLAHSDFMGICESESCRWMAAEADMLASSINKAQRLLFA